MASVITLLTDFGNLDGYVGIMKGVMIGICPSVQFIDLAHNIPSQHIPAARFTLLNSIPYFPAGTIHLAVVDPGVGTGRRAIAVQTPHGYLVGPDNGVFSGVLEHTEAIAAVSLTNPDYWLASTPSATFHGRDIFAPAAAHLAAGVSLHDLGEAIDPASLIRISIPPVEITETKALGHVQHVDRFGNIITTIPVEAVQDVSWQALQVGEVEIPFRRTYGDVKIGHALALVGSHGWVEIAVNGSSAQERLRLAVGDEVRLRACE